jgi:hypothetical protein
MVIIPIVLVRITTSNCQPTGILNTLLNEELIINQLIMNHEHTQYIPIISPFHPYQILIVGNQQRDLLSRFPPPICINQTGGGTEASARADGFPQGSWMPQRKGF